MPWTKNDPRKIRLLPLIAIFLVVIINKGASNLHNCQATISGIFAHEVEVKIVKSTCEAVRFVDQLVLWK